MVSVCFFARAETTADSSANFPPSSPPSPFDKQPFDWAPFYNHVQFKLTGFLYQCVQMPQSKINKLIELIACLLLLATNGDTDKTPPYTNRVESVVACKGASTTLRGFNMKSTMMTVNH